MIEIFCLFSNCKSQPLKDDCELITQLTIYLFFLLVMLDFERSAVFFLTEMAQSFHKCFLNVMLRIAYYMRVTCSDLTLFTK